MRERGIPPPLPPLSADERERRRELMRFIAYLSYLARENKSARINIRMLALRDAWQAYIGGQNE